MNLLIIIAVVVLLYGRTINYGLVVDDIGQYPSAQRRKKGGLKRQFPDFLYGAGLFKNLKLDHGFTILMTAVIGLLINDLFGFWPAIVYVCLPANNQIFIWLNGRRYQMSLFFALTAFKIWIDVNPMLSAPFMLYAFWLHPSTLAAVIVLTFMQSVKGLWLLAPAALLIPRMVNWLNSRFADTPEKMRRMFMWGKVVMAVKNLADYWKSFFWYPVFTLYHPYTWGIVEQGKKRDQVFSLDFRFWSSVGLLIAVHWLPCFIYPAWWKFAFLADLCVFQWLGFWKNPVQYWAPRYGMWFYLVLAVGLDRFVPGEFMLGLAAISFALTSSNMVAYKDIPRYYFNMLVRMPNNEYAHWMAINAFAKFAGSCAKRNRIVHAMQYNSMSHTSGFLYCSANLEPNYIHAYMRDSLNLQNHTNDRIVKQNEKKSVVTGFSEERDKEVSD